MFKVIKYVIVDILRNKFIFAYTLFLLVVSFSIFNLEDNAAKGLLSLLNIILIIVPLVGIIFSTIYVYNSEKFIELLVSQPVKRTALLASIYTGVCCSLIISFLIGTGLPAILLEGSETAYAMTLTGVLLSAVFSSLAILGSVITRDKTKGIGIAILIWLTSTLLYDGILLLVMFQFGDYPLEKAMILLSSLNPVDLARIIILLKMDIAALMSFTGAIFNQFFGTNTGLIYSWAIMVLWVFVPLGIALKKFRKKDL
jgi:Cu-processing system permease protein